MPGRVHKVVAGILCHQLKKYLKKVKIKCVCMDTRSEAPLVRKGTASFQLAETGFKRDVCSTDCLRFTVFSETR